MVVVVVVAAKKKEEEKEEEVTVVLRCSCFLQFNIVLKIVEIVTIPCNCLNIISTSSK